MYGVLVSKKKEKLRRAENSPFVTMSVIAAHSPSPKYVFYSAKTQIWTVLNNVFVAMY